MAFMSNAPVYHIDLKAFWIDPYPDLAKMRAETPIAYVPELDATLLTLRDDIFREEKRIEVFSSEQPGGLMTTLMGENMMRKDGAAHMAERKMIFPSVSPRTVRDVWKRQFESATCDILDYLTRDNVDLVRDFAMPVPRRSRR
jgi:cytochrome P450